MRAARAAGARVGCRCEIGLGRASLSHSIAVPERSNSDQRFRPLVDAVWELEPWGVRPWDLLEIRVPALNAGQTST